jgi:2-oxo-3-hexenedioate decarboxylase
MTVDVTDEVAGRMLGAWDAASLVPLPSADAAPLDMAAAWQVARELRERRLARGEQVAGWKIGFTNRSIWERYRVHAPIWGPVWGEGLVQLEGDEATLSLSGLCQPRLEPEIVFGFARTPQPGMDLEALRGCLAWVAHGFEIVHTHFEGWRFTAPDTVADFALHGRLLVGPRVDVAGWTSLGADLAALRLTLQEGGEMRDAGLGSVVLDGPLHALRHWLAEMAVHTPDWRVEPGHVVTTGTLTDAWPLQPGQVWRTGLEVPGVHGRGLRGLTLRVVA